MSVERMELYRWAVQDPETHVAVLSHMYKTLRSGTARVLREDFAGTSAESVAWVAADEERRAVAIDCDRETLAWARRRAERLLGDGVGRLELVEDDVLSVGPPRVTAADIVAALNFGVFFFHNRIELLSYFRHTRASLAERGILVFNLFGGPGALRVSRDERRVVPASRSAAEVPVAPFVYHWEQVSFDAVAARLDCRIHFASCDGASEEFVLNNAFHYDWRVWTLPELIELLGEAGFKDVQVWRHTVTEQNGKPQVFLGPVAQICNEDTWLAYVIGLKP